MRERSSEHLHNASLLHLFSLSVDRIMKERSSFQSNSIACLSHHPRISTNEKQHSKKSTRLFRTYICFELIFLREDSNNILTIGDYIPHNEVTFPLQPWLPDLPNFNINFIIRLLKQAIIIYCKFSLYYYNFLYSEISQIIGEKRRTKIILTGFSPFFRSFLVPKSAPCKKD